MIFTKDKLSALQTVLAQAGTTVIIGHRSPDGDAVGSTLALSYYLKSIGKEHSVIMPDAFAPFLNWLPSSDEILLYDQDPRKVSQLIIEAKAIFCLDFNKLDRVGSMSKFLIESKAEKILIDHHLHPAEEFSLSFSDTEASSTCELVYRLIEALGAIDTLGTDFFTSVYCGLLTDTGSFKYNVHPDTHRIAGTIIAKGIVPQDVQSDLFDVNSLNRLQLLGHLLSERLLAYPEKKASFMTLSAEVLSKYNYQAGDTEGFVNYGLSIKDCTFTALASEKDGVVKISFRSKGDVDVNVIAKEAFGGGGHKNAAGARSGQSLAEVSQIIEKIIQEKL
jgi:bifunctional oligoribonuclease and PAP phosphatase NrnA